MYIPKKISEEIVLKNRHRKIIKKEFLEKNWEISSYLIYAHDTEITIWTFILPLTKDGQIIYIKEYRAWPEKVVISFPVGALDDNITEIENCKKELEEETWYTSENIIYLWDSIIENYYEWEAKYYVALNCELKWKQELDVGENIDVYKTSVSDFYKMVLSWEVKSSKTAYCFLLAKEKGYFDWLL